MNQMKMILGKLTDLHHDLAHALQEVRGNSRDTANPKEAAEIAVVFGQIMHRFFLYEEFGSKYEEMLHNVGLASQNISDWENYQRGFEKLNNSIVPTERGIFKRKKSLTFGDLHIKVIHTPKVSFQADFDKPIQRVCKYPLLFADLCKNTPVIDGPDEHLELEKVLFRLRDTVMEINQATIDPEARERMQKSWKLQDMLTFPDVVSFESGFDWPILIISSYWPRTFFDHLAMLDFAEHFTLYIVLAKVLWANICFVPCTNLI